jgi:hypothetical protein
MSGISNNGVIIILDRTAMTTVFVSPGNTGSLEQLAERLLVFLFLLKNTKSLKLSANDSIDVDVDIFGTSVPLASFGGT